jgi:chromosome partitioning protein
MITTIYSEDALAKRSILAVNMAALYARNHRKALLIDATLPKYVLNWSARRNAADIKLKLAVHDAEYLQSELDDPASYYRTRYQEIIIDADGVDAWNADSALTATDVLVIPIRSYQGDLKAQGNLIQRVETARLFNPALRILIVEIRALTAVSDSAQQASDAVKFFSQKIITATLANTIIHEWIDDRSTFDRGLSIFECEPCNQRAVAEVNNLYQEILKVKDLPIEAAANEVAIMNAIQRRIHENAGVAVFLPFRR